MTTRREIIKGGVGLAAILAAGRSPAFLRKSMIAARQTINGDVGKSLPYDAEVEYLESTGTQYIDTGIIAYLGTSLHLIMSPRETYNSFQNCFCGAANEESSVPHYDINARNGYITIWNGNSFFSSEVALAVDKLYDVTIDASTSTLTTIVNGEQRTTSRAFQMYSSYTFFIFALNDKEVAKRNVKMRLFSFSITNPSGVLVRDMIPVRIGTEGAMYDRVSGQLFRNQGTGAFLYGGDVYSVPVETSQYVQDGLVAMWDGKENYGVGKRCDTATSWVDLSGNGYDAAKYGDVLWESNCAVMNGSNTRFLTAREVSLENFTFEACIKSDDVLYDREYIAWNLGAQEKAGIDWLENKGITQYRTHIGYGSSGAIKGSSYANSGGSPVDGATATLRCLGTDLWMYQNASSISQVTISTIALPIDKRVMLGGTIYSTAAGSFYKGRFYSLRIYSRALTAEEIAENYAVDKQRFNLPQA